MIKRSHKKKNKQLQKGFIDNWSINDLKKQYNAFDDPHAYYYLIRRSNNDQHKFFNKHHILPRNQTLLERIKQKIPQQYPKNYKLPVLKLSPQNLLICPAFANTTLQLSSKITKSAYQRHSNNKKSTLSMKKSHRYRVYDSDVQRQRQTHNRYLNSYESKQKKQIEFKNQQKHIHFISFLNNEKMKINSTSNQTKIKTDHKEQDTRDQGKYQMNI